MLNPRQTYKRKQNVRKQVIFHFYQWWEKGNFQTGFPKNSEHAEP
jgi:hypothetical protein